MRVISRAFFLAAVFFLMTPVLAALSIALYAWLAIFRASSLFPRDIAFLTSFIAFRICSILTMFRFLLLADCRSAFLADFVIGINKIVAEIGKKAILRYYIRYDSEN